MLSCIICKSPLTQSNNRFICKTCGTSYPEKEGIFQFGRLGVPSHEMVYFPDHAFDVLYRSEENNFWFRVRNKIIGNTIAQFMSSNSRILEVGCGTGYVSQYLKKKDYHIECADLFLKALQFCRVRNAGEKYYQMDLFDRLFIEEFEGICAFDVLEHIEDDLQIIKNLHDALKPGGFLFITVPADMRLWSEMDVYAEHKRRYSSREIRSKLEGNGFKIIKLSYFMTFLYPIIILSRKFFNKSRRPGSEQETNAVKQKAMNELCPNWILNSALFFIFSLEIPFIQLFTLPFGSSILCVAVRE
jgi:2-polyprenyl-3-methyl-5-hydroxy-6-metoxy-1,4-benzoquinol methylase